MSRRGENRQDVVAGLKRIGISPYYAREGITLYHAEGLDVLPRLPAESFDAVIADPPYCSGAATISGRAEDPVKKYCQNSNAGGRPSFSGDHLDQRSFRFWSVLWLRLACRATRPSGYAMVFSDWRQLPTLTDTLQVGGYTWRGIVPWDKGRGARAPHTGYFRHQAEYVAWGTRGRCEKALGRGPFEGVIAAPPKRSEKLHITGKSIAGMRELVKVTPTGGLILDPFAGSSSTLVAAILEGRRAIGIEREEAYCEILAERLDGLLAGGELAAAA